MDQARLFNLRHLDALLAVTRSGSISAAAGVVNLSQPALAQAIAKIERQVGQPLFERHAGGVSPTAAGRAMALRVERALRYLVQGARMVRRSARLAPLTAVERRLSMSQLRALVAVEEASSYAVAAQHAGLSQPALHRAVRELEGIMGVALFVRMGKAVRPTDAASRLVRFLKLMQAELRAAMDEVGVTRERGVGHVTVGALPKVRAIFLPDLLVRFAARHPEASVTVVEAPYDDLFAGLRQGDIDLVFGAQRDTLPAADVVQETLFVDEPVVVGRSDHPLLAGRRRAPADMTGYPWVIPGPGVPMRTIWERMFRADGVEPPQPGVESGSVLIARSLMLQGSWLSLMSRDQFLFERQHDALAEIAAPPGLRRFIALTRRRDWRPTPWQMDFIQLAHAVAASREDGVDALR